MPDDVVRVRITGVETVTRAFREVPHLARTLVDRTLRQALQLLGGTLKPYPPQPPRDRAKTFNTYVRGVGRYPRSAFPGGQMRQRLTKRQRGQIRKTSEQLGKRWTQRVQVRALGGFGMLGNTASYADVVQGKRQPYFHLQTGWVTVWAAHKRHARRIWQMFVDMAHQLAAVMRRIGSGG